MVKSIGKTLGKAFGVLLAALLLLCVALSFVACESNYPEIRITIQFNDNDSDTEDEYVLDYTLNRKLYPQTVTHYLELIDAKFYDGTVIHDFRSDRMVGGGYTYADMETDDHRDLVSLAEDYNALELTPSVWKDADYSEALNTLYGEVTQNGFSIDNDTGYKNSKGALGTYTYLDASEVSAAASVVYAHSSKDGSDRANLKYQYNAVTSLFYLYTGSSGAAESAYCVFGVLANETSQTRFDELLEAIDAYEAAQQEEDEQYSFTELQEESVNDAQTEFGYYAAEYNIPRAKIVIESVEVRSY